MKQVSEAMKQRKVEKYYIALVAGLVSEKKFTIQSDIGRDPNSRIRMTSKYPLNPKHAITHGEVLEYIDNAYTCVKIRIET